jgi:hypothetical protein
MNELQIKRHELYEKAFFSAATDIKKLVFYGIKMINTKPKPQTITSDETIRSFNLASIVQTLIGGLTPAEFMGLFPIDKDYDGRKYQIKDYFYTMDYISGLPDEPIGGIEAAMRFLWEYHSREIANFCARVFECVNDLRRLDGQPSLMEEWADKNGIKTYTMHTDQKGRKFMVDRKTGKSFRIKRKIPRYLRPVK